MPDKSASNRVRARRVIVVAVAVAIIATALFYFFEDPSTFKWMPKCAVYQLTGYQCPGCGSQRAVHALLHGDIAGAWTFNALLVCFIPVFIFLATVEVLRKKHPNLYRHVYSPVVIIIIAIVIIAWTIGRNAVA